MYQVSCSSCFTFAGDVPVMHALNIKTAAQQLDADGRVVVMRRLFCPVHGVGAFLGQRQTAAVTCEGALDPLS